MASVESPFVLCRVRHNVSLSPCHVAQPKLGIEQELTGTLMRHSDKLNGVVLSYSNVRLDQPHGHIMNEMPYIHCKVIADALVFQPREGMTLKATVNKIGSNHIGMLFAGVFNGSVAASELPKGFVHNYHDEAWVGADGSSISVSDSVEVRVLKVHVAGGMIAIEATMRPKSEKPAKRAVAKSSPAKSRQTLAAAAAKTASSAKKRKQPEPTPAPATEKKSKKTKEEKPAKEKKQRQKATEEPVKSRETKPKKQKEVKTEPKEAKKEAKKSKKAKKE
ncbi:TPA: hypothetical protein N0F65_010152 [Lagenidium giganteum]|uniref:DNA-directed RNA polymerase I subunit RPA43 n=1 Tax=Lagenidium giganteum TaxID=4803 RepID=A0AAV2Z7X6_9STRA|nr:TPA: hypothetical protein N0F65_010152 [Lagenidium giganteum]